MASSPGLSGLSLPCLLLVLLSAVLTLQDGRAQQVRVRRRLSWTDWSVRDGSPLYSLRSSKEEDKFRTGVLFQLYTRENQQEPELVDIYDFKRPTLRHFDPRRPTKVAVHGWMTDGAGLRALKNAFLSTSDVNFIAVNWTNIDTVIYTGALGEVRDIGQRTAFLLDFLRLVYGVPLTSVHLIGHSLGAHIAGYAGALVQWGKVGRLTGLDPAGPLVPSNPERRLDPTDALFVDVIHTCGNVLGYAKPIGHVDFYPNGGTCIQPGCTVYDLTRGTCSHNRAYDFMEESIYTADSFKGYPCTGLKGDPIVVDPDHYVLMGLAVPRSSRGIYCMNTRSERPFSIEHGGPEKDFSVADVRPPPQTLCNNNRLGRGGRGWVGVSNEEEGQEEGRGEGGRDLSFAGRSIYRKYMHQGTERRLSQ